jgi:hypothetical protein
MNVHLCETHAVEELCRPGASAAAVKATEAEPPAAAPGPIDPARLAEANINPTTGLATDYLNHFNEAIMLLELIQTMPGCIEDLTAWKIMSYREHFLATNQKHREVVLEAYEAADPQARCMLDEIADSMGSILIAACKALPGAADTAEAAALGREAAGRLRPLVARAGAVINGFMLSADIPLNGVAQAAVDALMVRRT